MIIGNIVSKTKVNVSENFNVVKTLDECIQGLPTLIVGWDFIQKKYPDYDILDRKLIDDTYWTFKKTERRDMHEEDIKIFKKKCYHKLTKNIKYIYIDPIHSTPRKIRKIFRKILHSKNNISYIYDDKGYIYDDNIIFGIDLKLIKYMNLNYSKILDKLKQYSKVFLIGSEILIEYKMHISELNNELKYVPFLHSLNHD